MGTPAENHRQVADAFGAYVRTADPARWDDPSPVAEWRARDVVGHLVEWLPAFLESSTSVRLDPGPSAAQDPVAAWEHHAAAVQALIEDPASAAVMVSNPHLGEQPLVPTIDMIYTNDVFLHTWDLAKATGQEVALDAETCAVMLAGMEPMDEMLRQSGQYGPKVEVPADADPQTRLMAFIGRNPLAWR
ncbi:MAG: TIGR03086 family protein [Nocardioidaceae bacterium]|nr:TIGR03086 family protein [Nocardioidaceae bacterium]